MKGEGANKSFVSFCFVFVHFGFFHSFSPSVDELYKHLYQKVLGIQTCLFDETSKHLNI